MALAPSSQAHGAHLRTVLGVDECVAGPPIAAAVRQLLENGEIFMAVPLWQALRRQATGEIIRAAGAPGTGQVHGVDWGARVPGDNWPDDQLVAMALGYLRSYRRVIMLSADRRGDRGGLRHLLNQEVGPVLHRDPAHRPSRVLLLQRPKTTIDTCASKVVEFVPRPGFAPGFHEVEM